MIKIDTTQKREFADLIAAKNKEGFYTAFDQLKIELNEANAKLFANLLSMSDSPTAKAWLLERIRGKTAAYNPDSNLATLGTAIGAGAAGAAALTFASKMLNGDETPIDGLVTPQQVEAALAAKLRDYAVTCSTNTITVSTAGNDLIQVLVENRATPDNVLGGTYPTTHILMSGLSWELVSGKMSTVVESVVDTLTSDDLISKLANKARQLAGQATDTITLASLPSVIAATINSLAVKAEEDRRLQVAKHIRDTQLADEKKEKATKCPNCGTPRVTGETSCTQCGATYA